MFINFDDNDELFHYSYINARSCRRVIGRSSQKEYIDRYPGLWDEFRKCIIDLSVNEFREPFEPRDIQKWIMSGVSKDGVDYEGTISVLNGKYPKGRVEANTGRKMKNLF